MLAYILHHTAIYSILLNLLEIPLCNLEKAGFVCTFRSACEEDEWINQSATCLFNVNDLLSTCPSADCNWQTDFDRKLLLADCLSCVLSASDHHFSFCPLCKWKWKTKREGKKGDTSKNYGMKEEKQERTHQERPNNINNPHFKVWWILNIIWRETDCCLFF